MTFTILKAERGQRIPRPFARATTKGEMADLIMSYINTKNGTNRSSTARQIASQMYEDEPGEYLTLANIDTDESILAFPNGTAFYAFTDR